MNPTPRLVPGLLAALVVAAVIPTVTPIYAGQGGLRLVVTVAAVALVGLASVASERAVPALGAAWVRLPVEAVVAAVAVQLVPAGPGGDPLRGLPDGAAQLVTGLLPAPASGPELGLAVAACAVAAGLAVELAAGRPGASPSGEATVAAGRRRGRGLAWAGTGPAALAPPAVVYVAALIVGGGGRAPAAWTAPLVVAAAGLYLLSRQPIWPSAARREAETRAGLGRVVAGLVVVAVVVAVAVPLGRDLPGAGDRGPYSLQARLSPPPQAIDQVTPLAEYAATRDGPVQPVFSASVQGIAATSVYWREAVYDQFGPEGWMTTSGFQRAGMFVPPPPGPAPSVSVARLRATVSLDPTGSAYLPVPVDPTSVSVPGLDVAPADGEIAVPPGAADPRRYGVTASVPAPTKDQLLGATAVVYPAGGTGLPPALVGLAERLVRSSEPSTFSRLTSIRTYLAGATSGFSLHPIGGSPAGNGVYQVMQLLTKTHSGTPEQYASAFALIARAMGMSTRLVVGWVGGTRAANGTVDYTTRDLTVWAEVDLAGVGWYPFPVQPGAQGAGVAPPLPAGPLGNALAQQQQSNAGSHAATPGSTPTVTTPPRVHTHPTPFWWVLLAVLAAALVFVLALFLLGKALRRRAQRGGDAAGRVVGAWNHVLDRFVSVGILIPRSATSDDVIGRAEEVLGDDCVPPLTELSALVDVTRYDRRNPVPPAAAEEAWRAAAAVDTAVRTRVPLGRRLRGAFSLAPWRR